MQDQSVPPSQPPVEQSESNQADEEAEEENGDESIPPSQPPMQEDEDSDDVEEQSYHTAQNEEAPKADSPVKDASGKASPIKSQAEAPNDQPEAQNEASDNQASEKSGDSKVQEGLNNVMGVLGALAGQM